MNVIDLVGKDAEIGTIREHLEMANFLVRHFPTESSVLAMAAHLPPALVLMDTSGGDDTGYQLLRGIRSNSNLARIPVVFISKTAKEEHRVAALELGATAFIVKPISPRELIVRIEAVLRSVARASSVRPILSYYDQKPSELEIDNVAMTVSIRGKTVETTTLEFRLVEYLARHHGRVFTRDELLDAVWGETRFVTPRSVDACVRRVRKKLEPNRESPTYLKAVRGVGYRLDIERPYGSGPGQFPVAPMSMNGAPGMS
jgi:two-component system phosphate regulon response regulator PhoB